MIKVTIPKDASEISVKEWVEWGNSPDPSKTVRVFTGLSSEEVNKIPYKDLERLNEEIRKAVDSPLASMHYTLTLGGVRYGFIPSLDNITTGEYVSIEEAIKQDDIMEVMAIVYRPIEREMGSRYTIEEYDTAKHNAKNPHLEDITLDQANGVLVFFSTLENESLSSLVSSLREEVEKNLQAVRELIIKQP